MVKKYGPEPEIINATGVLKVSVNRRVPCRLNPDLSRTKSCLIEVCKGRKI